jgi:hypothetical protein
MPVKGLYETGRRETVVFFLLADMQSMMLWHACVGTR